MKEFHSRKKHNINYLYNPIVIFLLLLTLALLVKSTYKIYKKKKKADLDKIKIEDKYIDLLNWKDDLTRKINLLKTEDGIKREIKSSFDVGEPGETILYITD